MKREYENYFDDCLRFRPGLRETLLTCFIDIKRRLCGIASVDAVLSFV